MTTSNEVLSEKLTNLQAIVAQQSAKINDLEEEIVNLEKGLIERDRKNLLWGISVLGGVVTTLISVIWNYRGAIFR